VVLYALAEGLPNAIRRSRAIVLIGLCTLPLLVSLLSHTQRPDTKSMQSEAGLYNQLAAFFHDNARAQTALESRSWYTTTRVGTSHRVIQDTLQGGPLVFLFGRGPRICLGESGQSGEAVSRYGIVYGIVGWSADALAVGWPAMFAHLGFYTYLFELLRRDKSRGSRDPYWKAIRLTAQLGFCVFLVSYFVYSTSFTTGGWLSSVHLYFLAVLLASEHPQALRIHPTVSHPPTARATSCVDWCRIPDEPSLPRPTLS
jgi:hypothetical protein